MKSQTIKKVVLIGDARVGKTSLIKRFVTGLFNPTYQITLGTTIMKKDVEYADRTVTLSLWDVGGQEVFKQIRSKYYYGSEGALAVCDASKRITFENLTSWVDSFREVVGDQPIVFIANKNDLAELEVTETDMKQKVEKHKNATFLFTSAKSGNNAEKAFQTIVNMMIEKEE